MNCTDNLTALLVLFHSACIQRLKKSPLLLLYSKSRADSNKNNFANLLVQTMANITKVRQHYNES